MSWPAFASDLYHCQVENVDRTKYLGVIIDRKLDWEEHINNVRTNVSHAIGFLKYFRKFLPQNTLNKMYRGIVEPHFRFCCWVSGCCGVTKLQTLQKLQNRAARIVTKSSFDTPSIGLIQSLSWPTVSDIIKSETATTVFKSLNGVVPEYLSSFPCLRFINSYLSGRKQRVKIGSTFTDWLDIVSGVPQGSVLGPLLFNIYVNDLIYLIQNTEICNFAGDNTIYSCGTNLDGIIIDLEEDLSQVLEWFESNRLVAIPSKFQMMLLGTKRNDKICMEINGATVCPSASVKLVCITIDAGLRFDQHVKTLCQKVNKNVKVFSRVAKLLDVEKAKLLYNSFLLSNLCNSTIRSKST